MIQKGIQKRTANNIGMMRKKRIFIVTSLFLIIIIGLRFFWIYYHSNTDYPVAKKGLLDLTNVMIHDEKSIPLNGEWAFYPGQAIVPTSNNRVTKTEKKWETIPRSWGKNIIKDSKSSIGYGTYQLRILLNKRDHSLNRLYIKNIQTAAKVYVNGKLVGKRGLPSNDKHTSTPDNRPLTIYLTENLTEIDLSIFVSNFEDSTKGGIIKPILLGTDETIIRDQAITFTWQLVSLIVLLLHFIYVIIIYFLFFRKREMLYLAGTFLCMGVSTIADNDKILLFLFPSITFEGWLKILLISYSACFFFLVQYFKHFLSEFKHKRIFLMYTLLCLSFIAFVAGLPLRIIINIWFPLYTIIMIFPIFIIPKVIYQVVISGKRSTIFLFLGIISIGSSTIWGMSKSIFGLDYPYFPFDLILGVICFVTYWFKRFQHLSEDTRALAEQLQLIDKRRDDFLANTSHELRNPLHGIINMAQTILDKEGLGMDEASRRNLKLLITVGQRMSYLLNDLLDSTRLKDGKIRLETRSIHLASIVSGVFEMLRFMKDEKNIVFVLDIPPDFPNIQADENRLIQILFNLIHNALKFSNEGEIIVCAEMTNGMATIHVKDDGFGMEKHILKQIFQPYTQGDSSITAVGGGIGLGLSICKQLVELHGGTITAKSRINAGSTFTFTLPFAIEQDMKENTPSLVFDEIAVSHEQPQIDTVLNSKRPRLLVVDDDPVNLTIFKQLLLSEQYDVITCSSGFEAWELLNKGKWDLVISDVMMPKMSGYELSRKIREEFTLSELPILLLTARSQPEDIQTGFMCGANEYVSKPVDKLEFLSRVKALLDIKYSIKERLRMEAAWLQAQIQPHFLYNTLNTIAALSEVDQTKMLALLNEFGNYLRASFDTRNLESAVPIKDEIELVQSYLYIEKERFGSRLTIQWDLDENISIEVPPLAIQTIVENAVKHGVLKRPQGGTICIQIKEKLEFVEIIIKDDGVGMSEQKLQQLLSKRTDHKKGIGLVNTDKRLIQLFGDGLTISSKIDEGTVVTFQIPQK